MSVASNTEINAALADASLKARFAELACTPMSMTPVEFGKLIVDETEKRAKVIKFANIRLALYWGIRRHWHSNEVCDYVQRAG